MGRDDRTGGGHVLTTKPFTRAPLLLLRRPAVFSAIAGAAAVLSLVAASTPLYLSSAGTSALARELDGRCPASYDLDVSPFLPPDDERALLQRSLAPRMLDPVLVLEGSLGQARFGDRSHPLKLMYRTDFAEDLIVVDRVDGAGLWMGERLAADLGASPGDPITINNGPVTAEIPLVAVVTDLYDRRAEPAWCVFENLLEPTAMGDLPTPLVFVDDGVLGADHREAAFATYGPVGVNEQWSIPLDVDGMTETEATALVDSLPELEATLEAAHLSDAVGPYALIESSVHTDIDVVTDRVSALTRALGTSIDPLAAAVLATALGLMGMAGSYWVDRRRAELRSLSARGLPPTALGLKAALEASVPMVVGAGIGWAVAGPVVSLSGPGGRVDGSAYVAAMGRSAVAGVAGIAVLMVVAAVRSRKVLRVSEAAAHGTLGPVLPVLFLAAAVWVRSRLGDRAVVVGERELVGSIDPLVVLYPMLAFTAAALAGGYLLVRLAPALGSIGRGASGYLASRRIASAPLLATVLVVGAAIPVATLIYSATLTRSTTSTIDAKGRSFVGADVSAPVYGYDSIPDALSDRSTIVAKVERADFAGQQIDILVVDPETFDRGAFFDPSFSAVPVDQLMARLGPLDSGAAPAIVANGTLGNGILDARGIDLPIQVVGTADAFPGARRDRPIVVVSRDAMQQIIDEAGRTPGVFRYLLWVDGATASEVAEALRAESIGFAFTTPASRTLDLLKFQSVVWTFDFLELYAALAGVIAIGAILLYSDTRQRARNLAYALARRMGLSRRDHIRASYMETAIPLLAGTALGAITALITARTVYLALDPVPETPPASRWVPAIDLIVITVVAALVLSWATAQTSQRAADTADTSELLRHGG